MTDIDKPLPDDAHDVTLTIRVVMNGKEVGSIIGKGGEIINKIREDSGCKIHITDGSVPERIVTVTGRTDPILRAFTMICEKLEDDPGPPHLREGKEGGSSSANSNVPRPPIQLRLVVPASQCGSLIGKGGSKIKEIREVTGASINVASEMLPQSTERAVTISGTKDAITQCVYHVCIVMLESPPKGSAIPYSPKGGAMVMSMSGNSRGGRGGGNGGGGGHNDNPLAALLGLGGGGGASTLAALATLAGSQIRDNRRDNRDHGDRGGGSPHTHEMSIPNDLIGCIIGKGGSKIAEIRQISGAMIRISKTDIGDDETERHITISGNGDSVALAKSLINMSLDLHKSKLESREANNGSGGSGSRDNSRGGRDRDSRDNRRYGGGPDLGMAAQLLSKPDALTSALTTLATFGSLGGLGGGLLGGLVGGGGGGHQMGGQVTGAHRSSRNSYGGSGSRGSRDDDRRDSKRSKFAPY